VLSIRWTSLGRASNPGLLRAEILTDTGLRRLHEDMFNQTWRWAGQYRKRLTNIGVDACQIPMMVRALCGDAQHWIENRTFTLV